MKFRLLAFYLFSLQFSTWVNAQINLIPNPGFEIRNYCPNQLGEIGASCKDWFTPITYMPMHPTAPFCNGIYGSSDYYSKCAINYEVKVPENAWGYQMPKSGDSYAGFELIGNSKEEVNYKEYLEVELINGLEKYATYCFSVFYSVSDYEKDSLNFNYKSTRLEFLFSIDKVIQQNGIETQQPQNIIAKPQIGFILPSKKETEKWMECTGKFIAQGGEKFLTVGNFQQNAMLDRAVYIYVDEFNLWKCANPVDSTKLLIIPNTYKSVGANGEQVLFVYKNQEYWNFSTKIYSRWGNVIFENNLSQNWDGKTKGVQAEDGSYLYIISATSKITREKLELKGYVNYFE